MLKTVSALKRARADSATSLGPPVTSTTFVERAFSQATKSFAPGIGRSSRAARRICARVKPRRCAARRRKPCSQSIRPSIPSRVIAATSASLPTRAASSGRNSLKISVFSRSKTTSFSRAPHSRTRRFYLSPSLDAPERRRSARQKTSMSPWTSRPWSVMLYGFTDRGCLRRRILMT